MHLFITHVSLIQHWAVKKHLSITYSTFVNVLYNRNMSCILWERHTYTQWIRTNCDKIRETQIITTEWVRKVFIEVDIFAETCEIWGGCQQGCVERVFHNSINTCHGSDGDTSWERRRGSSLMNSPTSMSITLTSSILRLWLYSSHCSMEVFC